MGNDLPVIVVKRSAKTGAAAFLVICIVTAFIIAAPVHAGFFSTSGNSILSKIGKFLSSLIPVRETTIVVHHNTPDPVVFGTSTAAIAASLPAQNAIERVIERQFVVHGMSREEIAAEISSLRHDFAASEAAIKEFVRKQAGRVVDAGRDNNDNFAELGEDGGIDIASGCFSINGECITSNDSGESVWDTSGSDAYYNDGNVGIGTSSPYAKLSVAGQVVASHFTATSTTATSSIGAGGFAVGTDDFIVQQNSGRVGVNILNPQYTLHVNGTGRFTSGLIIDEGETLTLGNAFLTGGGDSIEISADGNFDVSLPNGQFVFTSEGATFATDDFTLGRGQSNFISLTFNGPNNDGIMSWVGNTSDYFQFTDDILLLFSERLYFRDTTASLSSPSSGIIAATTTAFGIGTTSPYAKLSVVGQVVASHFTGTTTATSTFGFVDVVGTNGTSTVAGNLHVQGTLRAAVSYVGDLVFANNFRFTEGPLNDPVQYLHLHNQSGDQLVTIEDTGNTGFGTETPSYKVHVIGDIGAQGFINTSSKKYKKHITKLNEQKYDEMLEDIIALDLFSYRYKDEQNSAALRFGLIAEESPAEVLSASGEGVDLYKLTTFAIGGIKAQQELIEDLDDRISAIEEQMLQNNTEPHGSIFESILSELENMGIKIMAGVTYFNDLIADEGTFERLNSEVLEIGRGIEIKDSKTGDIYCVTIESGDWKKRKGDCDSKPGSNDREPELNTSEENTHEEPIEQQELKVLDVSEQIDVQSSESEHTIAEERLEE